MNPERELSTVVIDGKLPPTEIVKRIVEATANGSGVAIKFDDQDDNEIVKREISALLDRINQSNCAAMMAEDIEKIMRPPVLAEGNRKARRAAAAQRRGKR